MNQDGNIIVLLHQNTCNRQDRDVNHPTSAKVSLCVIAGGEISTLEEFSDVKSVTSTAAHASLRKARRENNHLERDHFTIEDM